jgi:hypothetical protein
MTLRKLGNPVQIVLIDDKADFRLSFKSDASRHRLIVKDFNNLQSAVEFLEEDKSTKFVVLDAKCFVTEGQVEGEENDKDFLMRAPLKIKEIAVRQERVIPFCIYTGYTEHKNLHDICPVFEKGKDSERLYEYIISEILKEEEYLVRNEYRKYFEDLEFCEFSKSYQDDFLNCCLRVSKMKDMSYKSTSRDYRPLLEGLFFHINENFPHIFESNLFTGGEANLNGIIRRLGGNQIYDKENKRLVYNSEPIMPQNIYDLTMFYKNYTSSLAMHYSEEKVNRNVVLILFHSLLEILCWYFEWFKSREA